MAPGLFAVACLIVINGPPGCGKPTLARMYAAEHALALVLDVDERSLGRWREALRSAGLAARAIAVTAARVHLAAGHDVVVPQFLCRPAMAVISHNHPLDTTDVVGLDLNLDLASLGIQRIPDHLGHGSLRISSLGEPQYVIWLGIDMDTDHSCTLPDLTS